MQHEICCCLDGWSREDTIQAFLLLHCQKVQLKEIAIFLHLSAFTLMEGSSSSSSSPRFKKSRNLSYVATAQHR